MIKTYRPEDLKAFKVFLTTHLPLDGGFPTIRFNPDVTYCFCSSIDIRALEIFMDAWANDNIAYISGGNADDLLAAWKHAKPHQFITNSIRNQFKEFGSPDSDSLDSDSDSPDSDSLDSDSLDYIKTQQNKIRARLLERFRKDLIL